MEVRTWREPAKPRFQIKEPAGQCRQNIAKGKLFLNLPWVFAPFSDIPLGLEPILKLMAWLLAALQIKLIGSLLDQLLGSLVARVGALIRFLRHCHFHTCSFSMLDM